MSDRIIDCDVAIVGAGSAGLPAYREVLKAGLKPLLIEGGPHGTMCARVGCMPSKLLIAAAQAAADARHADGFGIRLGGPPRVDGPAVMERVRRERDRFVSFVVDDVEAMPPEHRLDAPVEFLRDGVLRAADGREVHAERIILATGTRPNVPEQYRPLGELAIVNDDVFDWRDLPRSVLVIGSGVIGVELGLALARLGVRVRVLNRSDSFVHLADPRVRAAALELLGPELALVQCARVATVRREGNQAVVGWSVDGGPETVERFDRVLLTAGRSPALNALHLERTTMPLDERGRPRFDPATLQVHGQPVFLAGDVTGHHAIQHEASDDGRLAGRNAAAWPDVRALPRRASMAVVFSDPQIMQVGGGYAALGDPEAVAIGEVDWTRQGRSRVMLRNRGLLRVYMRKSDRRFLGAEMIGPDAEHVAHLLAWALQMELTVPDMLKLPFYHPTIEEGIRTALRDAAR
ncbi:dihydrolipoyl dehydrogenase [Castellaniella defragrans]|uniref:dihydrolipoyl dehydrogenase n=1 Tax=Castellaniella defragrans TaxID=75697 RepID=UPI0023F4E142|nr:dihydrolipoyl dehydrogenase [Castellaniella defragrans]